jgi:hypothetical protein
MGACCPHEDEDDDLGDDEGLVRSEDVKSKAGTQGYQHDNIKNPLLASTALPEAAARDVAVIIDGKRDGREKTNLIGKPEVISKTLETTNVQCTTNPDGHMMINYYLLLKEELGTCVSGSHNFLLLLSLYACTFLRTPTSGRGSFGRVRKVLNTKENKQYVSLSILISLCF